jgi:hypothetical protein
MFEGIKSGAIKGWFKVIGLSLGGLLILSVILFVVTNKRIDELESVASMNDHVSEDVSESPNMQVPTVDPWKDIRSCAPTMVKVELLEGNLSDLDQFMRDSGVRPNSFNTEQYRAYEGYYEVWQNQLLVDVPVEELPEVGRYTTQLWPSTTISSLDDIPSGFKVEVYNRNGWIGEGNTDYHVSLTNPNYCEEDLIQTVEWTAPEELMRVGQAVVVFDQQDGKWGHVTTIEVGRELTHAEIVHLSILATKTDYGISYSSLMHNLPDGGSFTWGNLEISDELQLTWNAPDQEITGVAITPDFSVTTLPMNHEIIVKRVWFGQGGHMGIIETSRFVLWEGNYGLATIVSGDVPTEDFPKHVFINAWSKSLLDTK